MENLDENTTIEILLKEGQSSNLNLDDLNNVTITSVQTDQIIKWNGTAWVNTNSSALTYTLPTASDTVLGGIKIGNNLNIDSNGVVSAATSSYSTATVNTLGLVKLGSSVEQAVAPNAVSNNADRTYAVQVNDADQLVVNVPWSAADIDAQANFAETDPNSPTYIQNVPGNLIFGTAETNNVAIAEIVTLSQSQYDSITPDTNKMYVII